MSKQLHSLFPAVSLTLSALLAGPVPAQQSDAASDGLSLEEVVVTARKTEEKLLDAPLSITAFSAADIEERGFKTLEDVAQTTAGVQYSQQGGQIPGRFTSAIRFRGMNVNSDSPSLQLGALFVDGVFVLGGTQSIPYDDIERIEVIKGPQAALYGRSTFGGAINYITRTPSLTEYSGQLSATGANYGESDVSGNFEGPIVTDRLSFRVGARYYSRGALFNATDGGGLGEESSKSAQFTLFAKPVEALEIRFRGFYAQDEDGPSTGGLVQGWRNNSCLGQTISTQDPAFPIASPMNYICGAVPEQGQAISALGTRNVIDTATTLFPTRAALNGTPNYILDNIVNRALPTVLDVPTIDHVGLIRTISRFSLSGQYEFGGGYTVAAQAGVNELKANWIRAFGLSPLGYWWSRDPQDSEDESYEIRISSPTEGRKLTWLAGVNQYEQTFLQSGSGGDAVWLCNAADPMAPLPPRAVTDPCTGVNALFPNSLAQNTDKIETQGIFASVSYAFTEQWSASLEARYQTDETKKAILTPTPTVIEEKRTQPRAILRWKPQESTNVYASWAKASLPPAINAEIGQATAREAAQYQALFPGIAAVVEGDELEMIELGWKQQWLDRRAQTSIALYHGKWESQKGRASFVIQEDCGSFAHGGVAGANAASGCPNGPTGLPAVNPNGTPFVNTRNANTPGNSTLKGVEFEGEIRLTPNWDLRGTLTYANSEYDDFFFNFVRPIAGFTQMKGNANARFPEWSGSLSSGYSAALGGDSDWTWYVNGDLNYVGKTYVDESNLAYCKAYTTANARVGVEKEGLRVEGFVRNLTDENAWASCARWTDFDSAPSIQQLTNFQGVAVTPLNPRQYGLRVVVKF
jgi:iron complex outermembrane recepter protein